MSAPEERSPHGADDRVLVLAVTGRDGELTRQVLEREGFHAERLRDGGALPEALTAGAGTLVLGEEALTSATLQELSRLLGQQPFWSDLPVIVLARRGEAPETQLGALAPLGNVSILERPVRIHTLVAAVRSALGARSRQYEVRELVRRLSEKDRHKDDFLAMLGHELRNPLGTISTALELVRMDDDEEERERHRQVIERQLGQLSRLVDDLLDVSRVTRGKISLRRTRVDLAELVEECVEAAEPEGSAGERIELELPDEPVWVEGDPVRLEQVVSNLLSNAVKYTPEERRIRVELASRDGWSVLVVEDEGVGIDEELLPRIFEAFTQVEGSLARSSGGLGLGLSLVRHLVDLHGGSVAATSDGEGEGSRFVVRLPQVECEAEPGGEAAGEEPAVDRYGPPPEVLVVEDQPDSREALAQLLGVWGHRSTLAADGESALEIAREHTFDVALVDIGLPGIDGYEVARRLRRLDGGEQLHLVALTGFGRPEDVVRAEESGFDDHLVKPVDMQQLRGLLSVERRDRSRETGSTAPAPSPAIAVADAGSPAERG